MKNIDAAGGVVWRRTPGGLELLLIFRNGVWDLPKGKRETGESFETCAQREVREETGADSIESGPFLIETRHTYPENGETVRKFTRWYAMRLPYRSLRSLRPQTSEGIEKLVWVNPAEAKRLVGYRNLKEVVSVFLSRFGENSDEYDR